MSKRVRLFWVLGLMIGFCAGGGPAAGAQSNTLFPVHPSIRANVEFWTKVYTKYDTTQGIVHDRRKPQIIYEIIPMKDRQLPGARKINRKRTKAVKKRYKAILNRLGRGRKPQNATEGWVKTLFGPDATPLDFREAARNLRVQLGQKDQFRKGLIRSGAYLKQIKQIFRGFDLPTDLSYLPHVESSFNYRAYSKFGAAGIWQFTRGTGRRYMTVNYTVDERRDPILASYAAARLLKRNYEVLGSWPMAITAYNHGTTGMLRAQRAEGHYEAIFNKYNGRAFGFASRNFYSEFLAARAIAKNYEHYFGKLALRMPLQRHTVKLPGYVAIQDLSRHFRTDIETLKRLNPALRAPVFRGQKYVPRNYQLKLPTNISTDPEYLAAAIPQSMLKAQQKHSRFYRVQRGDTAAVIARKHRVKLSDLMLANRLNRKATIYVGQNLRIPLPGEKILTASLKKSLQSAVAAKPRPKPKPKQPIKTAANADILTASLQPVVIPPVSPPKKAPSEPVGGAASESPFVGTPPKAKAFSAAIKVPVPAREPRPAPMKKVPAPPVVVPEPYSVEPSLSAKPAPVTIPPPALAPTTVPLLERTPPAAPPLTDEPAEKKKTSELPVSAAPSVNPAVVIGNLQVEREYTVKKKTIGIIRVEPEETLGHYADWLKIPTWRIRRLNGFKYGRPIHLGQRIKVPFGKTSKALFEERRYEYHQEIEEDFFNAYRVDKIKAYTIKKGDSIWALCLDTFEVPVWLVRKFNAAEDLYRLHPSHTLKIPVVEKLPDENGAADPRAAATSADQ